MTTTDAGRPLDVVADRRTGLVAEAARGRARRRAARTCASTPTTAARGAAPGKAVAERVTWDAAIDRLLS